MQGLWKLLPQMIDRLDNSFLTQIFNCHIHNNLKKYLSLFREIYQTLHVHLSPNIDTVLILNIIMCNLQNVTIVYNVLIVDQFNSQIYNLVPCMIWRNVYITLLIPLKKIHTFLEKLLCLNEFIKKHMFVKRTRPYWTIFILRKGICNKTKMIPTHH